MMKRNLANDPPPPHGCPSETSPAGWGGRRHVGVGLLTLLFFIGGFGNWSVLTEISGAVVAAGRLEVEGRRQIVQHPTGGVVDEILTRDGDRVEAGAVLLRLDGEKTRSELTIIEGQHFELLVRMDRLAAERDGRRFPSAPILCAGRNMTPRCARRWPPKPSSSSFAVLLSRWQSPRFASARSR